MLKTLKQAFRACSTHARACRHPKPPRELLPASTVPLHYRLFLDPDLKNFTYSGKVEIDVDVKEPTSTITLNAVDLEISQALLNDNAAVNQASDLEKQQISFHFPEPAFGKSTLKVDFTGILNDKLAGFYRSVHKDEHGNSHVVATTQMEPTDCRRAFPCFDEPSLKATFDISIAASSEMTVLSNGSVDRVEKLGNGKQVTHFETTPLMSTYLVAVVVGKLNYVESNKFRVPVRVYATPGQEHRCQYSADLAAETLAFFEEKFDVPYPLSKCDMVGIHEFSAGAMENWGLITFRLADLFFTEGKDSWAAKCRVTEVVQHELAHQWFGNLVTMDWWDGLWLNEGFATWMSWYAGNSFNKDWKVWESYVQDTYAASLRRDSVRSSHPVEVPIARAQEVDEIFDAISYNKGSCVIRMISQFLGEDVFIRGVSLYLKRHQYKNTTTSDLWNALSEVSGKDVERFMGPWTREVGFPLVTVTEKQKQASVEQHRFLASFDVKPEEDEVLWPVSLAVRKKDGSVDHDLMLTERSRDLDIDSSEFFKLNADQNGIYRVKYPSAVLDRIAVEGTKKSSKLSVEDKIGVLNDLNALAANEVPTGQLLSVAEQWKDDGSPNVVLSVLNTLSAVGRQLFFQPSVKEKFQKFHAGVVVPLADKYGLDSTQGFLETELRASLFSSCRAVQNQKYIAKALDLYNTQKFDIRADYADAVYVAVAEHGTEAQWNELFGHYQDGTNLMSGHAALFACGRAKSPQLQQRLLASILSQQVKIQDASSAFQGLMTGSPDSAELGWKWFASNWEKLTLVFPATGSMLGRMVSIAITTVNKPEHVGRVEQFFKDKNLSGIERVYASSLDTLIASTKSTENLTREVDEWLSQRVHTK